MTVVVHNPKNEQSMEDMYVVLSQEPDGTEGIAAKITNFGTFPLVFGHESNLEAIRPFLKEIAEEEGKDLIIAKYRRTEILERITVVN